MLRDLFNEGLSISEIARQTGHDRKTIRKYINIETPPLRKDRPEKPGKLDPFKDYIIMRLNEHSFSALIKPELQNGKVITLTLIE